MARSTRRTPVSRGSPVGRVSQAMSSPKRGAPEIAKERASSTLSESRKWTMNESAVATTAAEPRLACRENPRMGGSAEIEDTEDAVRPTGPSGPATVMMAMPAGCWPNADLNPSVSPGSLCSASVGATRSTACAATLSASRPVAGTPSNSAPLCGVVSWGVLSLTRSDMIMGSSPAVLRGRRPGPRLSLHLRSCQGRPPHDTARGSTVWSTRRRAAPPWGTDSHLQLRRSPHRCHALGAIPSARCQGSARGGRSGDTARFHVIRCSCTPWRSGSGDGPWDRPPRRGPSR